MPTLNTASEFGILFICQRAAFDLYTSVIWTVKTFLFIVSTEASAGDYKE